MYAHLLLTSNRLGSVLYQKGNATQTKFDMFDFTERSLYDWPYLVSFKIVRDTSPPTLDRLYGYVRLLLRLACYDTFGCMLVMQSAAAVAHGYLCERICVAAWVVSYRLCNVTSLYS